MSPAATLGRSVSQAVALSRASAALKVALATSSHPDVTQAPSTRSEPDLSGPHGPGPSALAEFGGNVLGRDPNRLRSLLR